MAEVGRCPYEGISHGVIVRCILRGAHSGPCLFESFAWQPQLQRVAQPDYCKKLEDLREWCDAQRAVPKEKFLRYANQEYNEGYRDAMAAVVRRIREAL